MPARSSSPPTRGSHVALLRGINVGGKNKLPMRDLTALFTDAGCTDVATYIQSGNVVFQAPAATAARVPAKIAAAIEKTFGLRVPVVLRSARELAAAIEQNPYLPASDPNALHLMFLADKPAARALTALDPSRSPGDEFIIKGRDVYLHLPNGVGRSKLTNAYFDGKLSTVSTIRNWRTVLKLAEMAHG